MKRLSLLVMGVMLSIMFVSPLQAKGLDRFLVRAFLRDSKNVKLDSVRVSLVKDDSIPVKFKLITGDDATKLNRNPEMRLLVESGLGKYKMTLLKPGYEPTVKEIHIKGVSEDVKYLGTITLFPVKNVELEEVAVTATRLKMVMKGDTIVYDAGAFQLGEGSMLEELVKQLPGATLDEDGVITVNGQKVKELLLNGKDFFRGNASVALKNLPTYTVKNIQVYDKAADDAYLTHSNAKIISREEDKNLVMSVELKKEYRHGWNTRIELGGGTNSRYTGRLFGMFYTDNLRLSAYVNQNNLKSNSGLGLNQGAGFDYTYHDKKWEINGNVNQNRAKGDSETIKASTNFYNTGDLYRRSWQVNNNNNWSVSTSHKLNYKGESMFLNVVPSFSIKRDHGWNWNRQATFNANPGDEYRGEAVDSIFSNRWTQTRFYESLLTALRTRSESQNDNSTGDIVANMTYRNPSMKGLLFFMGRAKYSDSRNLSGNVYQQNLGPQSTSKNATNSNRFSESKPYSYSYSAGAHYQHNVNKLSEVSSHAFSLYLGLEYGGDVSVNDNTLYTEELFKSDTEVLPSLRALSTQRVDSLNSVHQRNTNNKVNGNLNFGYNYQPMNPGDSTFNASYGVNFSLGDNFNIGKLDYQKRAWDKPQHVDLITNILRPALSFSLQSANKIRSISTGLNLSTSQGVPSIFSLLRGNTTSSNPLYESVSNPDLKQQRNFNADWNWRRMGLSEHRPILMFTAGWGLRVNAIANANVYDPSTGKTVSTPMNVNGNWNASQGGSYTIQFGARQQLETVLSYDASFNNSVDYVALSGQPVRSEVQNYQFSPKLSSTYRFQNGSTLSLSGNWSRNYATSERPGFQEINSTNYGGSARTKINLPKNFKINSSFTIHARRGFADKAMNTTEYLWNASVEKNLLKNGALNLKLAAYDLLQSVKSVSINVNAQGRTETWSNSLPRYVMLTASYRFDKRPAKKPGDNSNSNRGGGKVDRADREDHGYRNAGGGRGGRH